VLLIAPKRPFPPLDWHLTPEAVQQYILALEQTLYDMQQRVGSHEKRIEKLEIQSKKNSHNSSKPPSSDPPFARKKRKQKKSNRKKGGQNGHEPHQQQVLDPTETHWLTPECCTCGHTTFDQQEMQPFYVHQHIELPKIKVDVSHFILQQCDCPNCGKTVKAKLPAEKATGYGPRFTALIGELSGNKAMSRNDVKQLCASVLGVSIATGTIQKIIDRTSEALCPVYAHIGRIARGFWCNYIDETSWFKENDLHWLWAMVNEQVAFYRIDPHRSKEAFEQLIQDWQGILVSDGYGLYRKWIERQTCLAHLIRKAEALAESKKADLRRFGEIIAVWLRQLIHFAKEPPDSKQWSDFYTHLLFTLSLWESDKTNAGRLARQIVREIDNLWVFLQHEGLEPTNNRAERALRFGVLWRKRSLGTQSDKGNRWVERILSLKETCRLKTKTTFPVLVDCIKAYFQNSTPDLSWI
jgi:transposase